MLRSLHSLAMTAWDSSLRDLPLGKAKQSKHKSNESQWIASGNALVMTGEALIASYSANTRNDNMVDSSSLRGDSANRAKQSKTTI